MNNVIETEIRQREYDGRWERISKIRDYENAYSYKTETGYTVSIVPEKWITTNVYDYVGELE